MRFDIQHADDYEVHNEEYEMLERFMSYPIVQELTPTRYTFQYKSSTGKWLTYVPFFEHRQDAIGTRDLVAARGLEVSDIIELKE